MSITFPTINVTINQNENYVIMPFIFEQAFGRELSCKLCMIPDDGDKYFYQRCDCVLIYNEFSRLEDEMYQRVNNLQEGETINGDVIYKNCIMITKRDFEPYMFWSNKDICIDLYTVSKLLGINKKTLKHWIRDDSDNMIKPDTEFYFMRKIGYSEWYLMHN